MDDISQAIHRFLVQDFNQVLRWEEKVLSSYQQGKLSVNEFHIIEAVFLAMDAGLNNMGEISRRLGVTMGTLTTAVKTLETKGFLIRRKRQEDRRMVWLYPTHVAEEANRYHQMFHERLVSGVMDCLDHQQLLALVSALRFWRSGLHLWSRRNGIFRWKIFCLRRNEGKEVLMMSLKIIIDSTAGYSPEELEQLDLTAVPLAITMDGREYQDGVDLSPQEFYQKLAYTKSTPVTGKVDSLIFEHLFFFPSGGGG